MASGRVSLSERVATPVADTAERTQDFREVEKCLTEEDAKAEASRCVCLRRLLRVPPVRGCLQGRGDRPPQGRARGGDRGGIDDRCPGVFAVRSRAVAGARVRPVSRTS